ncbi:MAG TPA: 23S rRNA (guanosine(2251)-2'-O)-methyltransferase RlmB [Candidatus Methylomirabilis sp.]|nr:23S rRNA (guanosine(2251)-2'-O)-methyltransferase RlmB [Candidatus Methylomirabilis sp.]
MKARDEEPLFGRRPVLELLRAASRRIDEVAIVAHGRGPALQDVLTLARSRGVKVSFRTRDQLTAMAGTPYHQGVVARVAAAAYADLGSLLAAGAQRAEPAFLLALDRVQDPRNLGAVLRSAEATGAHGVILPKHESVGLTPGAAKSATGAQEWLGVARVANLVQALEALKKEGIWIIGTTPRGGASPWAADLRLPVCLVLGGEEGGLRSLVARTCDLLLTLPMKGKLDSLNVAAVAAVLCYEVVRQRGA